MIPSGPVHAEPAESLDSDSCGGQRTIRPARRHGRGALPTSRIRSAAGAALLVASMAGCAGGDGERATVDGDTAVVSAVDASLADFFGVDDPPEVAIIRHVMPEDKQPLLDDCLREAGYVVESPGSLMYPREQQEAAGLAQYICHMQYPTMEKYSQEWGAEQVRIQYAWTVEFLIPCLEERGHLIVDVPSETVFLDSWNAGPFYPFAQVELDVPTNDYNRQWRNLEAECLQIAASPVLWDAMSIDDWQGSR